MRKKKKNQRGQTSIEYLLMLAVSISLGMTFYKKMSDYFLKNPNSFITGSLNKFRAQFAGDVNGRPYKTFRVVPTLQRKN